MSEGGGKIVEKDGIKRCPYCNKSFAMFGQEYIDKHIAKCKRKLNPYRYSERRRGRPTHEEFMEVMRRKRRIFEDIQHFPFINPSQS